MRRGLGRVLGALHARIVLLLVGSVVISACAFFALQDAAARRWGQEELRDKCRATLRRLAREAEIPLGTGDRLGLRALIHREARDPDIVGIAVLGADGIALQARINQPTLWSETSPGPAPDAPRATPPPPRPVGVQVHSLLAPVQHRAPRARATAGPLPAVANGDPPAVSTPATIGWVRVTYSTARLEEDLTVGRRLALIILLLVTGLGFLASVSLLRVVVRPLRQASALAQEIADGNLARRLPVRADDELGALAESMNTMASALAESRGRERLEAATLRETAEAMIAIAQGARGAPDPAGVFRVVAAQLRRLTHCDGVALAVCNAPGARLRFAHFDPGPSWGGLFRGAELDAALEAALGGREPPPLRLQTASHDLPLASRLATRGFHAALLVPLAQEGGPPAALLLASRDDSAFRPAELRVVAGLASHLAAALHAAQLHARLERAFAELERTQEQLVRSERLRVAGELASGIAHEFNNVLAAIVGRIQLLRLRACEGSLPRAEMEEAFAVMELAASDGAETVRRLRQFGAGESGEASASVDLDAVLREAAEFTRPRWKNDGVPDAPHIDVRVDSSLGAWVRGNASQLREVFTNLILNAVDALPGGGHVRLVTTVEDDRVAALVEDDGVGMSPETLQRALEPFFTTKGVQGTGLGLSMVYGIVQRHGGRLAVRSHPGRGTRIELTFPRAAAAVPEPKAEAAPAPQDPLSVMVVDDEPAVRQLLVDILRALGHEVVGHGRGEAAVADFGAGRFDLVLTDLGMPGLDGWQLCQALRAIDPAVTIALVTGWGEGMDATRARRAGADAVVAKPFGIEDIARVTRLAARRVPKAA